MADSYHIIDGKVVPYSGGRKCNDTDAWRDATPLELQLQEQLEEYEHAIAAKDAEIEALRAELERLWDEGGWAVRWAPGSAYWSEVLVKLFGPDARRGIDALEARWRKELERADKLEEALRQIAEWPDGGNRYGQENIKRFAQAAIDAACGSG